MHSVTISPDHKTMEIGGHEVYIGGDISGTGESLVDDQDFLYEEAVGIHDPLLRFLYKTEIEQCIANQETLRRELDRRRPLS